MNEIAINSWLSDIYTSRCTFEQEDLIYKLGDLLNWELAKIDCFFDMYIQDPTRYTAQDLLPNGMFSFDHEMQREHYKFPL